MSKLKSILSVAFTNYLIKLYLSSDEIEEHLAGI
jgi:hypothetical protein